MTRLLAVYGTLKQRHHNYEVYLAPRRPVVSGFFKLDVNIYTNGRYPMLVKSNNEQSIFLEIYEISEDLLSKIDKLESPFGYHREILQLGDLKDVWIYYYTKGTPPDGFTRIESGNFEASVKW
ncbi:MAG: gamma-glutamylcyclotransferase family protein [Candidatus Kariarchaeaceae archaeon]